MINKKLFQSKTFWFATAQAVVGAITIFATEYNTVGWLAVVKSVADVYLRTITNTKIG